MQMNFQGNWAFKRKLVSGRTTYLYLYSSISVYLYLSVYILPSLAF